jgi:Na+-transporting NADH:ubiquinone oxidoreductase subunit B
MGESAIIFILLAAVYLMITKTASWVIIASTFGSGALLMFALNFFGLTPHEPLTGVMSGSFLFVAVFMATDPVSAPKKPLAQMLYGIVIGCTAMLIRMFNNIFTEGTSFAVLIGNTFAMLLDEISGKKKA